MWRAKVKYLRMRSEFLPRVPLRLRSTLLLRPIRASNPGTSGLCIQANVVVTLRVAGNGDSTNGSSDTPHRPRKRIRHPESWKKNAAKAKRAKGEAYISPNTGKAVSGRTTGPDCHCTRNFSNEYRRRRRHDFLRPSMALQTKTCKMPICLGLSSLAVLKGDALEVPRHCQQLE